MAESLTTNAVEAVMLYVAPKNPFNWAFINNQQRGMQILYNRNRNKKSRPISKNENKLRKLVLWKPENNNLTRKNAKKPNF